MTVGDLCVCRGDIAGLDFIGFGAMMIGSSSRIVERYIGGSGLGTEGGFRRSFDSMDAIRSLTLRVGGAGICSCPVVNDC